MNRSCKQEIAKRLILMVEDAHSFPNYTTIIYIYLDSVGDMLVSLTVTEIPMLVDGNMP